MKHILKLILQEVATYTQLRNKKKRFIWGKTGTYAMTSNQYGEEISKYYEFLFEREGYYDHQKYAQILTSIFTPRSHLLEIGIGTGSMAIPLVQKGYSLVGVDYSEPMLAKAKKNIAEANVNIPLIHASVEDMQIEEQFDGAFSNGGPWVFIEKGGEVFFESELPSKEADEKALRNVANLLKPGAVLAVNVQPAEVEGVEETDLGEGFVYKNTKRQSACGQFMEKSHFLFKGGKTVMNQTFKQWPIPLDNILPIFERVGLKLSEKDESGYFYLLKK